MSLSGTSGSLADLSSAPRAQTGRVPAIAMMCMALLCFACLDTSAKFLGHVLPPAEIAWARYSVAGVFALFLSGAWSKPRVWISKRPGLQALRSSLLLGSTLANFIALTKLQLAETSTINFLQPIFVALMAGPLIGERIGGAQLAAIGIGFLGVVVATGPGAGAFQPIALVSIAGVVCGSGYALTTRKLASCDSPHTTLAWTQMAGVVALTPALPFIWKTPPTALHWTVLAGTGVFAVVGHLFIILAHRRAPASVLTPFNYTQLIWMVALGFVVFGDVPPVATLVGAGLVFACGLFLVAHERRSVIGGRQK